MANQFESDVLLVGIDRFEWELVNRAKYDFQHPIDNSFEKHRDTLFYALYFLVLIKYEFLFLGKTSLFELYVFDKLPVSGDFIAHEKIGFEFLFVLEDISEDIVNF